MRIRPPIGADHGAITADSSGRRPDFRWRAYVWASCGPHELHGCRARPQDAPVCFWKALRGVDGWLHVGGPEEQVSLRPRARRRRRAREQIQRLIERPRARPSRDHDAVECERVALDVGRCHDFVVKSPEEGEDASMKIL